MDKRCLVGRYKAGLQHTLETRHRAGHMIIPQWGRGVAVVSLTESNEHSPHLYAFYEDER